MNTMAKLVESKMVYNRTGCEMITGACCLFAQLVKWHIRIPGLPGDFPEIDIRVIEDSLERYSAVPHGTYVQDVWHAGFAGAKASDTATRKINS